MGSAMPSSPQAGSRVRLRRGTAWPYSPAHTCFCFQHNERRSGSAPSMTNLDEQDATQPTRRRRDEESDSRREIRVTC